jgi:hypothetical protein
MKATLILAAAFALSTTAALAQTVAPGTTPGAQTGTPSNMPSAGSTTDQTTTTSGRMDNMSASGSDKRAMRKAKKTKTSDGTMKTKTKM